MAKERIERLRRKTEKAVREANAVKQVEPQPRLNMSTHKDKASLSQFTTYSERGETFDGGSDAVV